jgi:hypothetical protein
MLGYCKDVAPGHYEIKLLGFDLTIRTFGHICGRQRPKIVFGKNWVALGISHYHIELGFLSWR